MPSGQHYPAPVRLGRITHEAPPFIHPATPRGQRRERGVLCTRCRRVETFNICAACNGCCSCPDRPGATS